MINDDLVDYISHELAHGTGEAEIRHALSVIGWSDADISENLLIARQRHSVTPIVHENESKEKRTFLKKHSKAVVVMGIVALLLAGSAFAAYRLIPPSPEKMLQLAAVNMEDVKSLDFSGRITADVTTPDNLLNLQAFVPKEILDQLFDKRVAGAATNLEFALDFKGTVDGSDENNPKGEIELDVSSSIFTVGMKMRVVGDVLYFNLDQVPPIAEEVNQYLNTWIKVDPQAISKQYGLGINFEGIQPNLTEGQKQQIKDLTVQAHLYNSVTKLGNDTIDGVTTYHYSIVIDKAGLKNYLEQVEKINKAAGGTGDTTLQEIDSIQFKDVEVWVGKSDRMVRRISMQISQASSNDSIPTGSVRFLMNFSNFNNPTRIETPATYKNLEDVIKEVMAESDAKTRDARRLTSVHQVQTALELYFNDNNRYPRALTNLRPTYISQIPAAVTPPDGTCTEQNNTFAYTQKSSGQDYGLSFCLGRATAGYSPGAHTATSSGIQ